MQIQTLPTRGIFNSSRPPCRPVAVNTFKLDDTRQCVIREGKSLVYQPVPDGSPLDLLVVRDDSLMINVEANEEYGMRCELQERLAELWIALVETPANTLTQAQASVRERLLDLFSVETIEPEIPEDDVQALSREWFGEGIQRKIPDLLMIGNFPINDRKRLISIHRPLLIPIQSDQSGISLMAVEPDYRIKEYGDGPLELLDEVHQCLIEHWKAYVESPKENLSSEDIAFGEKLKKRFRVIVQEEETP